MSILLNPYLGFRDSAREAMTFYQSVFGGELTISTFAEFQASEDPAEQDKVMHAELTMRPTASRSWAPTRRTAWITRRATTSRCR